MANINFGILDTQSPAKIGNAFIRSPEQQNANMLQAMQMQGFVNQNELAQSQLRTARRAEEGQALLGQAYAGADFGTGGTAGGMAGGAGQSPYPSMRENIVKKLLGTPSAYLIPGELAKITEMENKETTNREAQGKVEKQARDAVDYTWKQYQTEVPRVTDAAGVERWTRATHRDKLLGPIVSRFKTEDQAVADAVNLFNSPGGANKWATQNMGMSADKLVDMLKLTTRTTNLGNVSREVKDDFFGNLVGSAVDTPIGISPNTVATLKQAQDHYNGLSAYQKEQLKTQGISFDSARGVFVNARNNTYSPIDPFASGAPTFTGAPASPAGVAAVPGGAAGSSGGGVPGQRQTPEGRLGPMPEKPPESYYKEVKGVINTNDAINNLKQIVSNFTSADMVNPARRAEIDTAHKTAILLSKEMFNLGVLNGGDQKILEQVIPDPIAFSKGLVPIETIRKNLDAASNVVSRMNNTLSRVHKQPLLSLDAVTPNAPSPSAPPIQSFRRP